VRFLRYFLEIPYDGASFLEGQQIPRFWDVGPAQDLRSGVVSERADASLLIETLAMEIERTLFLMRILLLRRVLS